MSDPSPHPIAGWYPDPENAAVDRWWNGVAWSDHRRAGGGVQPYAGTPGAAPARAEVSTDLPAPPPYAPNYAPRTPMANVPAFAGMITSLSALLFNFILFGAPGVIGGIISIAGLVKANRLIASGLSAGHGRGSAIAGIVAGFGGALLWNLFYFAVLGFPFLR